MQIHIHTDILTTQITQRHTWRHRYIYIGTQKHTDMNSYTHTDVYIHGETHRHTHRHTHTHQQKNVHSKLSDQELECKQLLSMCVPSM